MNDLKWTLSSSQTVFETTSKGLRIQKRVYICEDGRTKTIELKDEGPYGHVFAITRENKVILIRQFRIGPDKYYYESPAGSLNWDQNPQEEALRELREESGYTSSEVMLLQAAYDGPYTTAMRYMFLAKNCIQTHAQQLDEDEYIDQVHLASFEEVKALIKNNEYNFPILAYLAFENLGLLEWKK